MKYKIIYLAAIIVCVVLAVAASTIKPRHGRYHQHKSAVAKEACTDHDDSVFCTHLPLMEITTDAPLPEPFLYDENGNVLVSKNGYRMENNELISATVKYFDNEKENNHLSDAPVLEERANFRVRGASSRDFDKKGYLLKFRDEERDKSKKVSFSGMEKSSEWALHGPFLDKTLIRNYMCYNLSGEIMEYAPDVRFCELFLNGEYMGLYLIIEKIDYDKDGRLPITKTDQDLKTTSFVVLADRGTENPEKALKTFASYSYLTVAEGNLNGQLEIVYPSSTLTPAQHDYIEDYISRFEKSLFSFDYNSHDKGYRNYVDIDSFIDYFLINEFTLNYDAVYLSTYLYRDLGGKLKLCVWDFNSAFDYYEYSVVTPETFELHNRMWYKYLFKDERFVDQTIKRYYELRKTYFNEEYMFDYIDETVEYLGPAIDRNYEKWGYSFNSTYNGQNYDYLKPAERNVRSYDEAIAQMKDSISERIGHMDANIERLRTLSHASLNKKYNLKPGGEGE